LFLLLLDLYSVVRNQYFKKRKEIQSNSKAKLTASKRGKERREISGMRKNRSCTYHPPGFGRERERGETKEERKEEIYVRVGYRRLRVGQFYTLSPIVFRCGQFFQIVNMLHVYFNFFHP